MQVGFKLMRALIIFKFKVGAGLWIVVWNVIGVGNARNLVVALHQDRAVEIIKY